MIKGKKKIKKIESIDNLLLMDFTILQHKIICAPEQMKYFQSLAETRF